MAGIKHLLIIFALIYSVNSLRASHGEACAPGIIRCNSRERLSCINGTCQCAKPDEMRYEKTKNKCVVISGERCSFAAVEILTDERHYTEKFDCVDNAVCSSDGYCDCIAEHFEDDEGSCLPKGQYGQNCKNDKECKAEFVCDPETKNCSCNKAKEIFSSFVGKCVGLAEAPCTPYNNNYYYGSGYHCVTNALCDSDSVCKCNSQYFEQNGTCVAKRNYGDKCSGDNECLEDFHLTCQDETCRCTEGEAVFSPSYGQCVGLADSKCGPNNRCILNAECSSYDRYSRHYYTNGNQCNCVHGFKSSKSKTCVGDYGSTCDGVERNCSDDFPCLNGQCHCPFPFLQTYDTESRSCKIYIRGPCKESVNAKDSSSSCPENSSCQNSTGVFQCECNHGYVEQLKGCRRKITLGIQCTPQISHVCGNSNEGVTCKNGICTCKDFHEYNDEVGICQGLVGALCDINEETSCVDLAFCRKFQRNTGTEGVCQCKYPAKPTMERKCVIVMSAGTKANINKIEDSSEDLPFDF